MLRSELISRITERLESYERRDIALAVELILGTLGQSLKQGNRIEIRGFGVFRIKARASRTSRNPKTGEKVFVPKKHWVHFKASRSLLSSSPNKRGSPE